MPPEIRTPAELAAAVETAEDARALLARPSAAMIRAVALRADHLRFTRPKESVGVAAAAVGALARSRAGAATHSLAWAAYGSALRAMTRFDEAEAALMWAARLAGTEMAKIDVARRLATLRATEGRRDEARAILPSFLERARRMGPRVYGEELVAAGAILVEIHDFARAAELTKEALRYLPASGDLLHLSAVGNLCRCRLELASGSSDLREVVRLARETESLTGDDYTRSKFLWLRARLQHRLGDGEAALATLLAVRPEIEASAKPLDHAALLVDVAHFQLELGEEEKANRSALESFPLLGRFKERPEVYQAIRTLQRAAESRSLSTEILTAVRSDLSAAGAF